MRSTLWYSLAALCLILGQRTSAVCAGGPRTQSAAQSHGSEVVHSWNVIGYGEKAGDAQQIALENGRQAVIDYLAEKRPDLGAPPSIVELCKNGTLRVIGEPVLEDVPNQGPLQKVTVQVQLTRGFFRDREDEARKERATHRLSFAFSTLFAALGVLAVVGGYLRLEEMLTVHFRAVRRTVAVVVVVIVGAAWYVFS